MLAGRGGVRQALQLVGELLEARGASYEIVVIGGSALILSGVTSRATTDVDILAFAQPELDGSRVLIRPAVHLPSPLAEAASIVASDIGLAPHWLNTGPASQWDTGLPPGLADRIVWESFAALQVGVVGRWDLICFKLYAAADDVGTRSVHYQDLVALSPTDAELRAAADWIQTQDPTPDFVRIVNEVVSHVRHGRGESR